VVLYEMLTGELPYDAETPVGVVMKHVSGVSRSPRDADPEIPEEIDAVAGRLLSRKPEERYPDAATLAEDLRVVAERLPEVPETEGARAAGVRAARNKRGTRSGTSGRKLGTGGSGAWAAPAGARGTRRQRVGVLAAMMLVLVSIGVIAFVALRQGGGPSAGAGGEPPTEAKGEWAAGAKKTPDNNPPKVVALDPGKYVTDEFEPAFTFSIGKGGVRWADAANEQSDAFFLMSATTSNSMWFLNAQAVYDVSSTEVISAPSDLTAWFQRHPYLKTSDPTPVTVGGVPGKQFDVAMSEVPPARVLSAVDSSCSQGGDDMCVPTFVLNTADTFDFYPAQDYRADNTTRSGEEYRVTVLDDIAGETVAIVEDKAPDNSIVLEGIPKNKRKNEKFFSQAQDLLDTVQWEAQS